MVTFLRDVMIVVAIVATLIALAFYPGQEPDAHPAAHDIPVGVPPVPTTTTAAGIDTAGSNAHARP